MGVQTPNISENPSNNFCLICLEENPDALPPCQGVMTPLFHKKCLSMAIYSAKTWTTNTTVDAANTTAATTTRCPHCNQTIIFPCPYTTISSSTTNRLLYPNGATTKNNDGSTVSKNLQLTQSTNHFSTCNDSQGHNSSMISINHTIIDLTNHNLQSIMNRWLQDKGYWVKGPEYIQVTRYFLMNHNDANIIFSSIEKTVSDELTKLSSSSSTPLSTSFYHSSNLTNSYQNQLCDNNMSNNNNIIINDNENDNDDTFTSFTFDQRHYSKDHEEDAFVFRHRDPTLGIETDVIIRRTAIYHNNSNSLNNIATHGAFLMDGFTVSMSRSRYSKRVFRKGTILEKNDFILSAMTSFMSDYHATID